MFHSHTVEMFHIHTVENAQCSQKWSDRFSDRFSDKNRTFSGSSQECSQEVFSSSIGTPARFRGCSEQLFPTFSEVVQGRILVNLPDSRMVFDHFLEKWSEGIFPVPPPPSPLWVPVGPPWAPRCGALYKLPIYGPQAAASPKG